MRSGPVAIMMLLTIGIAAIPATSQAQGTAVGYAFGGPSWLTVDERQAWMVGGGGEMVTGWKGTTMGLEAARVWFPAVETDGRFRRASTATIVSLNVSRHLRQPAGAARWQPFLTGGASIVAGGDAAQGGFTIGGGVDRWFTRHAGVRIDVRDHFLPGSFSLVGARIGIVLR
jgi:hypothetical protein